MDGFFKVKLDSRRPDSRELDTVNVRLALRQAKEEREEQLRLRQLRIEERIRLSSRDRNNAFRYISGDTLDGGTDDAGGAKSI